MCWRVPVRTLILQEESRGELGPQRKTGSRELRTSPGGQDSGQHSVGAARIPGPGHSSLCPFLM